MANKALEGLPPISALTGTELLYFVQGGNSRSGTLDEVRAFVEANLAGATDLRLPAGGDATLSSTNHPFQIGDDAGSNLRMDNNEIQTVNNGTWSHLLINPHGGDLYLGNAGSGGNSRMFFPSDGLGQLHNPSYISMVGNSCVLDMRDLDGGITNSRGIINVANFDGVDTFAYQQRIDMNSRYIQLFPSYSADSSKSIRINEGSFSVFGVPILAYIDPASGLGVGNRDYNDARYAQKIHYDMFIEEPEAKQYQLTRQCAEDCTFNQFSLITAAGTCDVQVILGATAIGTYPVTTAENLVVPTPTDLSEGQAIRFNVSNIVGAADLTVSLIGDKR